MNEILTSGNTPNTLKLFQESFVGLFNEKNNIKPIFLCSRDSGLRYRH